MKTNKVETVVRNYGEPDVRLPRHPTQVIGDIELETGNDRLDAFNDVINTLNKRIAYLEALFDIEPSMASPLNLDVVTACRNALRKVRDDEAKKITEVRQPFVHGHWNPEFME